MPPIVLLPMDDRPVNYDYPRSLARMAGLDLHLPPREWLGNPWRASRHAELVEWLKAEAQGAAALILALDTLGYGGLIPSRTSREPLEKVLERLEFLRDLKARRPELPIYASSVILRISRANSCEEEKDYWAVYGSRMFRLSYLEHKAALGEASAGEMHEAESLRDEIPDDVYDNYRGGRRRNHSVNQTMLRWAAEGVFDYLLLPQDDTADYGWNIAEARTLQGYIRHEGLSDRAITYPGADEIGCLLLAAYACRSAGFLPRVWPRYSSVHSPGVVTAYEDRPIHELIKAHLAPLGGSLAETPDSADLLLYVNAPTFAQGNGEYQWAAWNGVDALRVGAPPLLAAYLDTVAVDPVYRVTRREMESPQRSPEEFVRALCLDLSAGRAVALADVAYVNGADLVLGNLLVQRPEAARLCAYGGWNTAGNTLGTVLAQAMLRVLAKRSGQVSVDAEQAHLEFLFLRWMDDYYYQARERSRTMLEDLPHLGLAPGFERLPDALADEVAGRVRSRLLASAAELEKIFQRSGLVKNVRVSDIYLPWQRLFEVGMDVQVTQG
jgi:hypothetical protein